MISEELKIMLIILKAACPHLQNLAKKTGNPFDDYVVGIICSIASLDIPLNSLEKKEE